MGPRSVPRKQFGGCFPLDMVSEYEGEFFVFAFRKIIKMFGKLVWEFEPIKPPKCAHPGP